MAELYLRNKKINSIFELLGKQENDISFSVGWALAESRSFLQCFLERILSKKVDIGNVVVRLQQYESGSGITDIEIEAPGKLFLIIEAKRGWNLPSREQLQTYAIKKTFGQHSHGFRQVVVLSECSRAYADAHLEVREVEGVRIEPYSWKDVAALAKEARRTGSHAEKRLMEELLTYLEELMTMQNLDSNWVYVVALANGTPKGWAISWKDIAKKKHLYFHPVGGHGWPKEPPNYIAFRYGGKLQSIHHIDAYEILTNMHLRIPEARETEWEPHFLYSLGPAFAPSKVVPTGRIYPNGRVWCMLDTLFTSETISDARDLSKQRQKGIA